MLFKGQIIRNQPMYRPRPRKLDGFRRFSDGPFEAYVADEVLALLNADARRAAPNETIGYLVGRPFRDERGEYLIVTAALSAPHAHRRRAFVETTVADERSAAEFIQRRHPVAERVGWYHSHPFASPHYSETDRHNQQLWCPEPYQLGLLVCVEHDRTTIHGFRGPGSVPLGQPWPCMVGATRVVAPAEMPMKRSTPITLQTDARGEEGGRETWSADVPRRPDHWWAIVLAMLVLLVLVAGAAAISQSMELSDRRIGRRGKERTGETTVEGAEQNGSPAADMALVKEDVGVLRSELYQTRRDVDALRRRLDALAATKGGQERSAEHSAAMDSAERTGSDRTTDGDPRGGKE